MKPILIMISLFYTVISQSSNSTSDNYSFNGFIGIGWGTFAVIVAIVLGVLICIFGSSTTFPK